MKSIFLGLILIFSINSSFANFSEEITSIEKLSVSEIKTIEERITNEVRFDFFACYDQCMATSQYEADQCVKYCYMQGDL